MRTIVLATLALAVLAGCSQPRDKAVGDVAAKPTGPKLTPEEKAAAAINDAATKRPEGHYEFPEPGEGGWNGSTASIVDVGKGMDAKANETKNALCQAAFTYDDPSVGMLTGKPEIRIQDAAHFEVEYMMPDTKGSLNRIKGDGKKRAELLEAGWVSLPSGSKNVRAMTEQEVAEWPRRFPVEMFSHYTEGADSWGPLFDAWRRGVGGYKAVFEEQTFTQGKSTASHFRVYAKTTKGSPTTVEVIVDKEFLRPLTIKVDGTLKDGRKYNMYWTGKWKTGGKYDPSAFIIPPTVPRTAKAS